MVTGSTLDALKRFWWLITAFAVGGALIAGLPAPQNADDATTRWTASHTILVSSSSNNQSVFSDPLAFNQLQLFATTGQVPTRAAEAIGYGGAPAALAAQVTVTVEQQSGALRISTTQETADRAVAVADTFADELVTYLAERQDRVREDRITSALERLQTLEGQVSEVEATTRADPEDAVAQAQLDALSRQYSVAFEQFNALQADEGSGQLVLTTLERAQPVAITERGLSAPNSRVSRAALGAMVGALLGAGLAVMLARRDRKLRTREQVEEVLGIPAHVTIPYVDHHDATMLSVVPQRHDPLSDSYRTLRSIITFLDGGSAGGRDLSGRDRGSVTLVVSPGPGDGKTSIAANLAAAFAEAGERTTLINADFRRPTLAKRLGVDRPAPTGLTLPEIEHAPLELVLAPADRAGVDLFDLASIRDASPGDLARVTARVLPRIAAESDRVVMDTSPLGATAEVLEFVPAVDTIVVVVTLGHSTIQSSRRAIEMLRTLSHGELLLAIIGGRSDAAGYYYYYSSDRTDPGAGGLLSRLRPGSRARSSVDDENVSVPDVEPLPHEPTDDAR